MLEYRNFSPLLVFDVFINCEEEHEGKEETGSTEEVPNIVPEKRGGDDTFHICCSYTRRSNSAADSPG